MAKRNKSELEAIQRFVDGAYNRLGNILYKDLDQPFDPKTSLGYCFKHIDPVNARVIYKIVCAKTGIKYTDFRVMMHEYGHIYLGHLDGIHEELDTTIVETFRNYRGELIEEINKNCGIDFADKLIERVIDDPVLNHSLHNIAMDMEVNSKILSKEDVEEMEADITTILPKTQEKALEYIRDHTDDEEAKKKLDETLKKMAAEAKIKLILPERYKLGVDDQGNPIPFPDELTYGEYLLLIITHLDQFVKMLVSIQLGGNGDTAEITKEQIQEALQKQMEEFNKQSEAYKKGYEDAQNDYANGTPGQSQAAMNGMPDPSQLNLGNPQQQGQLPPNGIQPPPGLQPPQQGQQQGQQGNQSGQQDGSQQGGQQPGAGSPGQSGQGQPSGQGNQPGNGQGQSGQGQGQPGNPGQGGLPEYNRGYNDGMRDAANGQGGGSGMQGLSGLMSNAGMSPDGSSSDGQGSDGQAQGQGQNKYQGMRKDPNKEGGDGRMDHRTPSRDEADQKRELGRIRSAGGMGCGSDGGPYATREVIKEVDEVEMALNEVMRNVKARVVKKEVVRDTMRLYNRGIIRSVIAPAVSQKITISVDPKIVYLIDISGSMDTELVDRILKTIGKNMRKLNRGLKYDIITWSTHLGEHIKDIDPKKGVPRISMGGGTSIATGIKYFKDHYSPEAILIVISDFEDYLQEWHEVEKTMSGYSLYGFNYGDDRWNGGSDKIEWKNMKVRKFSRR